MGLGISTFKWTGNVGGKFKRGRKIKMGEETLRNQSQNISLRSNIPSSPFTSGCY